MQADLLLRLIWRSDDEQRMEADMSASIVKRDALRAPAPQSSMPAGDARHASP